MSRRQELLFCSAYRKQISAVSRRNRGWATWNAPATRKRRILPTRNCSRFARSRLIRWWSTKSLYGALWHNPRASTSIGELIVQADQGMYEQKRRGRHQAPLRGRIINLSRFYGTNGIIAADLKGCHSLSAPSSPVQSN